MHVVCLRLLLRSGTCPSQTPVWGASALPLPAHCLLSFAFLLYPKKAPTAKLAYPPSSKPSIYGFCVPDPELATTACILTANDSFASPKPLIQAAVVVHGPNPAQVGSESPLDEDSDAFAVLSALGGRVRHIGGIGAACAMKLALNQLIVSETVGCLVRRCQQNRGLSHNRGNNKMPLS
jgi:hypothetical protein